jgi:hypothetical protein
MERITGSVTVEVLGDDRHAFERTVGKVTACLLARFLEQRMDHRVQLRIELLDASDRIVDELERSDFSGANEFCLSGCV